MKNILVIILSFLSFQIFSQNVDTIIKTEIYTSYFSKEYKQPLYVNYKLYNGGGKIDRGNLKFISYDITAKDSNYYKSGFDKGHLVNAEDFAYDSTLLELTFRYYNCLPQTPNLNRGVWKRYENIIRKESKKDTLNIICGGSYYELINDLYVPKYCWKVVYLKDKLLYAILFTNKESDNSIVLYKTYEELEKELSIKIVIN